MALVEGVVLSPAVVSRARAQSGLQQQWETFRHAQDAYEEGIAAQDRGDTKAADAAFDRATGLFNAILKDNPNQADVYPPLADMLIRRGKPAPAYFLLSRQVHDGVGDPAIKWQLARALRGMHQTRRALTVAQQVADQSHEPQGRLDVIAFIGECAAELGDDQLAIDHLTRMLSGPATRKPEFQRQERKWRLLLAGALSHVGRHGEALSQLESLVAEQPGDFAAREALAVELCHAGRPPAQVSRGLALFDALGKEQPQEPSLALHLGEALLAHDRAAAAVPPLRRYVAAQPNDHHGRLLLGKALSATGSSREAVEVLQQAGDDGEALWQIGRIHLNAQPPNLPAAEQALFGAVNLLPSQLPLCIDHGSALLRLGRLPQAVDEARRCTRLDPGLPAQALLARAYQSSGKLDDAIATYLLVIKQEHADAVYKDELVRLLLQHGVALLPAGKDAGKQAQALGELEEAHRLRPSLLTARSLAMGDLASGKRDEALRLLQPLADAKDADALTVGAYARALREAGRADEALAMFRRALSPHSRPEPWLAPALRAEVSATLIQLKRAGEVCTAPERDSGHDGGRDGHEDPVQLHLLAAACLAAGRGDLESGGAVPKGALLPLGIALRLKQYLSETERAEAEILMAVAQTWTNQPEVGVRRLQMLEGELGKTVLQNLLGPGGFDDLLARAALHSGQLPLGTGRAQHALLLLPKADGQRLQTAMAAAYVSRALIAAERGDSERALNLLRSPPVQAETARRPGVINYDLGAALFARGKRDEALLVWNRPEVKDFPEKWIGLGTYHDAAGDRRAALDDYRHFLQHTGTGPLADKIRRWTEVIQRFYGGGKSQSQDGRTAGAALASEKEGSGSSDREGDGLALSGEKAESRTEARRPIKLSPHVIRPQQGGNP